ncbi:MAG: branched-chain amino acid ABC transporter permease [Peptococcaceae bacterium]|nr:branched-chain amino acid ABC transporter permease [Peptococcaceae bacterium]
MDLLNVYHLQIITFMAVNSILALSFYLPLSAGQLSLGCAGFMSIGAYTAAILSLHYGLPVFTTIPAGAAAAALAGVLLGFPALRLTGVYLAIATLGFGEVVRVLFLNLKITNGALGMPEIPNLNDYFSALYRSWGLQGDLAGLDLPRLAALTTVVFCYFVLAACVAFVLRQENSRTGRAMAAVKADEVASGVMGIGATYIKMLAFVQGAFLAGLAGAISAHVTNFIAPGDFNYHRAVNILLFVVLGGSELVWGGLLGAAVLSVLPEFLRFMQDFRWIIFGALLAAMMVFRPQGLLDRQLLCRFSLRKKRAMDGMDARASSGEVD